MASSLVDMKLLIQEYKWLDEDKVYNMTSSKSIPHYKNGKQLLFDLKEVEAYFRSRPVATKKELRSQLITHEFLEKRKTK